MYKTCSQCGRIHPYGYKCKTIKRDYRGGAERQARSTYAWTIKSKEIRDKAQHLCEVCRDKGVYTYNGLEVHHIEKIADNPDGLLDEKNLVCLCQRHHKDADDGKINKDYLRNLALMREKR